MKLSKEDKKSFEDLVALQFSLNDYYITEAFEAGFSLAVKLIFESLTK